MNRFTRSLALGLIALGAALQARAVVLLGGNDVIDRAKDDIWTSFTVLDRNNPIVTDSLISQWSVWLGNAGSVELAIFRPTGANAYTLVGNSSLVSGVVGLNNFVLTSAIAAQSGDVVGALLETAEVDFSMNDLSNALGNLTGTALFSANHLGLSTTFVNSANRTYSISVFGTPVVSVPEPTPTALLLTGLVVLGIVRRRKIASGRAC